MTPEFFRDLQTAIMSDPECLPYIVTPDMGKVEGGAYKRDLTIAKILSSKRTRFVTKRLSSLGLASRFPASGDLPGPLYCELVLQKMEIFATTSATSHDKVIALFGAQIKRQMLHLAGEGIDFGDAALHDMFDAMVAANAITADDADALKSVAREFENITADHVSRALRGPWGD